MTDKNEVVRSLYEITGNITDHNTVLVNIAELETLRAGYAAARLEIESLRARSVEPAGAYPVLPDAPLSVFSKGPWTFKETGQNFSGAELDEAAFVAYRDRASHAQAPAQADSQPASGADWLPFSKRTQIADRHTQSNC